MIAQLLPSESGCEQCPMTAILGAAKLGNRPRNAGLRSSKLGWSPSRQSNGRPCAHSRFLDVIRARGTVSRAGPQ
jgi:hypothetical protein